MDRSLAVIVPLYNDAANIEPFYARARAALERVGDRWRIVFVNDGSTDAGLERVMALHERDPRVEFISLSRNFGYHAVLLAGLTVVDADLYAMIDVDCEDPPELLADFHGTIGTGADIAYGIRSDRREPGLVTLGRRIFYYLNRLIADSQTVLWMSEFAMITRAVRDAIIAPRTTYVFLRAEIAYAGFARVGLPYVRAPRTIGRSHFGLFSMTRFALAAFLASSTFPLRLVLYIAVVLGITFPVVALAARLELAAAASLATIVLLYFVLLALPTLALYLARTYKNGVARPLFIVDRKRTSLSEAGTPLTP